MLFYGSGSVLKRLFSFLLMTFYAGTVTSVEAFAASPPPSLTVSPSPAAASGAPVVIELVKGGTPVDVSFSQRITSRDVQQGNTYAVIVDKDVDIAGMVVIPKGAVGQATLTKVRGAGGNGSGGQIDFTVNWVYSEDGGKIALSDNNNATANADRKGEASTLAIAGYLTFGVLGLFSHNIARGRDAVIPKDKVFHVFVDHDVHVATNVTDDSESGFDH